MAKDTKILLPEDEVIVEESVPVVRSDAGSFEIVPPPPPQNAPPTEAQLDWMRNNPRYARMSHGLNQVGWSNRGTLRADGTFIDENRMPVHDGNGDFGVGIPIGRHGF